MGLFLGTFRKGEWLGLFGQDRGVLFFRGRLGHLLGIGLLLIVGLAYSGIVFLLLVRLLGIFFGGRLGTRFAVIFGIKRVSFFFGFATSSRSAILVTADLVPLVGSDLALELLKLVFELDRFIQKLGVGALFFIEGFLHGLVLVLASLLLLDKTGLELLHLIAKVADLVLANSNFRQSILVLVLAGHLFLVETGLRFGKFLAKVTDLVVANSNYRQSFLHGLVLLLAGLLFLKETGLHFRKCLAEMLHFTKLLGEFLDLKITSRDRNGKVLGGCLKFLNFRLLIFGLLLQRRFGLQEGFRENVVDLGKDVRHGNWCWYGCCFDFDFD